MTLVDVPPITPAPEVDHGAHPYVVIGGGPAGLSAGYLLAKAGEKVLVLEADDQVGGIAKTVVDPDGYRFDLGGHRFFTKNKEVDDLWHEIMGDEFLKRPRMSRIFWRGKFLDYPLKGMDVIKKLGPIELLLCGLSYLWAQLKPKARRGSSLAASPSWGPSSTPRAARKTSSGGFPTASASACSATSSRATPRRCGACRATRSAPSGPRSASRACPSPARPRPPSWA